MEEQKDSNRNKYLDTWNMRWSNTSKASVAEWVVVNWSGDANRLTDNGTFTYCRLFLTICLIRPIVGVS